MTIAITVNCEVCGETKSEYVSPNTPYKKKICSSCELVETQNKRSNALEELKKLTLEERVSRIEASMYDKAQNPPASACKYDHVRY